MQGIRISNIWRGRSDSGRKSPTRPSLGGSVGGDCCTIGESLQGMFRLGSNMRITS
jgi:hypothetical protein